MKTPSSAVQLTLRIGASLAVMLALAGAVRWLSSDYERTKSTSVSQTPASYTELDWQALVPAGWDPLQRYRHLSLDSLDDGSPQAVELARQMRETWDKAPTNPALDGARVRIAGYVVPLDAHKGEMREFLLVPYFGACIHTPPPPANQIIHVSLAQPVKDLRTMAAVSVNGTLRTARSDSPMGTSGYTIEATAVGRKSGRAW